ncbi:type II CAAX prenyl endopeptidase Rce1 family protein [Streptomyces sp. VRA16 Mangrove soil]|uniref:CPBP family glutamic-type intramembrane protease n=1 Tax=Streptomyces sp. VRA16 Mangrove soil TaxID=2817434 RepID=UPI001A9F97B3|nr:CPBP family glutamic-type intramembrane protease [Streptomyces sp. VRA16 Mangrove soil]MBO1335247.1 CPBP family intramembrane metalloprotease [Streptomyces sp. VRA16 Mangrove soil]
MDVLAVSPEFTAPALALSAAAALWLAVGEPFAGRRMYASLARRRETQPRALVRYFRVTLLFWAAAAALVWGVWALSPGITAADLGLTAGDRSVAAVGAVAAVAAGVLWSRRLGALAREGRHVPGLDEIAAMLPRTRPERRWAVAVAVADALGSELLYRGLLIAFGVGALGLNLYGAAALALLIYAGAGLYQGRAGCAAFGAVGFMTTWLYLFTGSLLLPVVVHLVLSLRDLVYVPTLLKGTTA